MSEPSFNFFCAFIHLQSLVFLYQSFHPALRSGLRGWVVWWPQLAAALTARIGLLALWLLLHFFIFLFYFRRHCEWSVAMGITDTMRDTLLLEFSQVRATLTDPRVPLCLPSCGKRRRERNASHSFLSFFLLFFQLIKERDVLKRA